MKKLIFTLVFFAGTYALSSACNVFSPDTVTTDPVPVEETSLVAPLSSVQDVIQVKETTPDTTQEEFKEVAFEQLSEALQTAAKGIAGENSDIIKVEFCVESGNTRLSIANKSDKSERIVTIDKDGKEVNISK